MKDIFRCQNLPISAVIFFLFLLSHCQRLTMPFTPVNHNKEVSIEIAQGNIIKFSVEIADTAQKREQGLMFRRHLPANEGMLFIFDQLTIHPFWMKNTYLPLDLIFFDDNFRIVGMIENAIPMNDKLMSIEKPSRYVLEVIAGTIKKHGIDINSLARFTFE